MTKYHREDIPTEWRRRLLSLYWVIHVIPDWLDGLKETGYDDQELAFLKDFDEISRRNNGHKICQQCEMKRSYSHV